MQDDGNLVVYERAGLNRCGPPGPGAPGQPARRPERRQRRDLPPRRLPRRGRPTRGIQGRPALPKVTTCSRGRCSTRTSRSRQPTAATRSSIRADGNLVLYGGGSAAVGSGTDGNGRRVHHARRRQPGHLRPGCPGLGLGHRRQPRQPTLVQDDGNVVIYRPDGTPVWATDTFVPRRARARSGDDMQPGEVLTRASRSPRADGRYTFVYQSDGNLVLYDGGSAAVGVGHRRQPAGVCIMQGRRQPGHLRRGRAGTRLDSETWGMTRAADWSSRTTATSSSPSRCITPIWTTDTVQP